MGGSEAVKGWRDDWRGWAVGIAVGLAIFLVGKVLP
jgi:hypothetical protein